MPHTCAGEWATSATSLDAVVESAIATSRWAHGESALLDLTRPGHALCMAFVGLWYGRIHFRAGSNDCAAVRAVEKTLRAALPRQADLEEEKQRVPVAFWTADPRRGRATREMEVPRWAEIEHNYPEAVQAGLSDLMAADAGIARAGQLILWHGEPGMGKTTALRALAWEWRSWCRVEYITDPDVLFGGSTAYLMDLLLHDDDDTDDDGPPWRLLVLEDTGELLSRDAKARSGQGLSRMLNLVDGMIGQGLRVLVLATANEPLGRLHPAVARSGRSAATIEFGRFTADEAAAWLVSRGASAAAPVPTTLATLYARVAGREASPLELPTRIGFVR